MFIKSIKIGDKEYNCKLNTKACVQAERRLGKNPLNIFTELEEGEVPSLEEMLIIFHEALSSLNHGISTDDVFDLYDNYLEDGHSFIDFVNFVTELFKEAGFIKAEEETNNEKN